MGETDVDFGTDAWIDSGAATPPPSAQPSFNSPATTDSFSIRNSVSTGVDAVSSTAESIFGSVSSLLGKTNAAAQASALGKQQQQSTQRVQLAQSTAQQHSAQVNANIASALDSLTASPLMVGLVLAGIAYMLFFRAR